MAEWIDIQEDAPEPEQARSELTVPVENDSAGTWADVENRTPYTPESLKGTDYDADAVRDILISQKEKGFDTAVRLDKGKIAWALESFKGVNPETAARVQQLAKERKVPADLVMNNKEEWQNWKDATDIYNTLFDVTETKQGKQYKYPNTAQWLQDPLKMAQAKDDIKALTDLEGLMTAYNAPWYKYYGERLKGGAQRVVRDVIFTNLQAAHEFLTDRVENLDILNDPVYQNIPGIQALYAVEKLLGESGRKKVKDALQGVRESEALTPLEIPQVEGFKQFAGDFMEMVPQLAGSIGSAVLTGPAGGGAFMGSYIFGSTYGDLTSRGVDPDRAATAAFGNAVAQSALETYGLNKLMKLFKSTGGKEIAFNFLNALVTEFGTEALQAFPEEASRIWGEAEKEGQDLGEQLNIFWDRLPETAKQGLYEGLVVTPVAAFGGSVKLAQDYARYKQVDTDVNYWENYISLAENSKLKQRNPEEMENFLRTVNEKTEAPSKVSITLDKLRTFFQEDQDGFKKFTEDMGINDQIAEADATGKEVELDSAKFAAKYAGSELEQAIRGDLRFNPDGLTVNEQKAFKESYSKNLDDLQKEMSVLKEENVLPEQAFKMRETLMMDRSDGGFGLSAQDADAQLAVFMAGARTLSSKRGETLQQWFDRVNPVLNVGGEFQGQGLTQFAGPLAETADLTALEKAKSSLEAGEDAKKVRQDTGWFKGLDNKWRFEISDAEIDGVSYKLDAFEELEPIEEDSIKNAFRYEYKVLSEILDHRALYDAYPELANIGIEFAKTGPKSPRGFKGEFRPGVDRSSEGLFDIEPSISVRADDVEAFKSTLIHEIQHYIQEYENFAKGGNLSQAKDIIRRNFKDARKKWFHMKDIKTLDAFKEEQKRYEEAGYTDEALKERNESPGHKKYFELSKEISDLGININNREYIEAIEENEPGIFMDDDFKVFDTYRRFAGELEARITQKRRNLPKEFRAVSKPLTHPEITSAPIEDAIIFFQGEGLDAQQREIQEFQQTVRDDVRDVATKRGFSSDIIEDVYLVGSRAKGAHKEGSDIDIVVKMAPDDINDAKALELEEYIQEYLDNKYKVFTVAGAAKKVEFFVTTELENENVIGTFFQGEKAVKGSVQFNPNETLIKLYESANLSTFLHETGHIFTQEVKSMIESGIGDEQLAQDYVTLLEFAGGEFDVAGQEKIARGFEAYLREGKAPSVALADAFNRFKQWLIAIYKNIAGLNVTINDEIRGVFDRMLAAENDIKESQEYYKAKQTLIDLLPDVDVSKKAKVEKLKEDADKDAINRQLSKYMRAYYQQIGGKSALRDFATREINEQPIYKAIDRIKQEGLNAEAIEDQYGKDVLNALEEKGYIAKKPKPKTLRNDIIELGGIKSSTLDKEQKRKLKENKIAFIYRKDGYGLDQLAEWLVNAGKLFVPENVNPGDYLFEQLLQNQVTEELTEEVGLYIPNLALDHGFDSEEALISSLIAAPSKKDAINAQTKKLQRDRENEILAELQKQQTTPGDEALHSDASLSYLIAEESILAEKLERAINRRPDQVLHKAYKDAANGILLRRKVKDATAYHLFAKAEQRFADQSYNLAQEGDLIGAHEAKKKQLLNHALVQAAIKLRDEKAKIEKRYQATNIKKALGKVENAYANAALDLIDNYKLSTSASVAPSEPGAIANLKELDLNLYELTPDWIVRKETPDGFTNYRDLSFQQLRELDETIRSIMSYGNDELKSIEGDSYKTVEQAVNASIATMAPLKDKTVYGDEDGFFKKSVMKNLDGILSSFKMAEFMFERLDNYSFTKDKVFGPLRTFFNRGVQAETDFNTIRENTYTELKPHMQVLYKAKQRLEKRFGSEFFDIPGLPVTGEMAREGKTKWTVERMISFVLNMGNEGNKQALINSYKYTPEQMNELASLFNVDELNAIQGVWDAIDKLFPDLDKQHFTLYNRHLKKVDALPVDIVTADGQAITLKGGYYPLQFDHLLNLQAERIRASKDAAEEDLMKNRNSNIFRKTKPDDGFTFSRTPGHSLPPLLSLDVLFSHISDTARYISHAAYLRDLNRLTLDTDWTEAVRAKAGRNVYKYIRDWVSYQAVPERRVSDPLSKVLDKSRRMATLAILGANISVGLKQRVSMINAAQEIGAKYIVKGIQQTDLKNSVLGLNGSEKWEKILDMSQYMRTRAGKIDREISDTTSRLSPQIKRFEVAGKEFTVKDVQDLMFEWINMNDRATVGIVWYGAFNKYMDENSQGQDNEQAMKKAVLYADAIVRNTQPSSLPIDLSAIQKAEGPARLFTSFMTFTLKYGNRVMGKYEAWQDGAMSNKEYFRHVLYDTIFPGWALAVIGSLWVYGDLPEWEDLVSSPFETAISWLPIIREVSGAFKYNKDVGLSPAFEGANRLIKAAKKAQSGMVGDASFLEVAWSLGKVIEFAVGVPALKVVQDIQRLYRNITQ